VSTATAEPDTDFDEATPPPRTRPQGEPVGRYVTLPPGESICSTFLGWDNAGRIPANAVLAHFVGAGLDRKASGYVVVCYPQSMVGKPPLGGVEKPISPEALEAYRIAVVVVQKPKTYVVLTPKERP